MKILVLCTGNSCRSQMAEGWLKQYAGSDHEIYSAGLETHGLNPVAVEVMEEAGVDISNQESHHLDRYEGVSFDYVITVCDHAREQCPFYPAETIRIHAGFEDPAGATGSEEEKLMVFRKVRDEIKTFAKQFTAENLGK